MRRASEHRRGRRDRRRFSIVAIACLLVTQVSHAQREVIFLDGPWSFCIDSTGSGITDRWFQTGLTAHGSRLVTVPHTWNVEPGTEEFSGCGWYVKRVEVPARWKRRAIQLRFEGVYHTARVWIDGVPAGEHCGSGYTPFTIDGSRLLVPGKEHLLVVRADNSFSRSAIPFLRSFDWPKDGGIIRPVSMVATGRPGIGWVHVHPRLLERAKGRSPAGELGVTVWLTDTVGVDLRKLRLAFRVEALQWAGEQTPLVAERRPRIDGDNATATVPMDSVSLWRFDSPALYRLGVSMSVDGVLTDSVSTSFGFRELRTSGTRLLMNGEPVRLMGVEWMSGSDPGHGMAEPPSVATAMLARMRSVNAIFTRFHWQQTETVLDWCDRNGILVQEEIPLWGFGVPLNDTVMALARSQLREMITAHYNHPSVVMWGVGNELASTRMPIIDSIRALRAYARALDSLRLVNYVSNRLSLGEGPDASGVGDIVMWNEYQDTWYLDDPAGLRKALDSIHVRYPEHPVVISEYGLCEPANQGGDERRCRDMVYHTAVFEQMPFVAGAIYFCLNDYRTHWGEEGSGVNRRRVHGVFDFAGTAKSSAGILRMISSPVEILNVGWKTAHRFEVVVIASSGLPSHPLRGYALHWSAVGTDFRAAGIRVPIPDLLPGQKVQVPLDSDLGPLVDVTVVRPTGEIVARRTFEIRP